MKSVYVQKFITVDFDNQVKGRTVGNVGKILPVLVENVNKGIFRQSAQDLDNQVGGEIGVQIIGNIF